MRREGCGHIEKSQRWEGGRGDAIGAGERVGMIMWRRRVWEEREERL